MNEVTSKDLGKVETEHSALGTLSAVETVKSAAHAAKQKLHLHSIRATGPSKWFNPTNVHVHVKWKDEDDHPSRSTSADLGQLSAATTANDRAFLWRSRDNRKRRNAVAIPTSAVTSPSKPLRLRFEFTFGQITANIWRMCTTFPYWDMAFWSGWSYSVGSILFVIDGSWSFISVASPESQSENLSTYGGPLCFFIGALFYQIGATIAYLEAVNDGSFQGSAMRRFLEGHEEDSKKMMDEKIHSFFGHFVPHVHGKKEEKDLEKAHDSLDPEAGWRTKHRRERPGSIYPTGKEPAPRRGGIDYGEAEEGTSSVYMTWRWFPTWKCLKTHHVRELGYLACATQLFGATLYGMTGVVVLPGILSGLASWQTEAAFWIPQIVASTCFLTASILFTLETQEKWYRPELGIIGWWIGFWACIGSVGFLLIGIFGAASYNIEWGEYQADLTSIWGSSAYLISSLLQWYEAVNKHPVDELFNEPGEMKSFQVHPI